MGRPMMNPYARGGPMMHGPSPYDPPVRPRGIPVPSRVPRGGGRGGYARGVPAVSGLTEDTAGSKKVNCKLFALGKCNKGGACVFVHQSSASVDLLLAELEHGADEGDEEEEEELKRAFEAQALTD